jgi:hypothetical protein
MLAVRLQIDTFLSGGSERAFRFFFASIKPLGEEESFK